MYNRWVWVVSLGLLAGAGCNRKGHGGNDAQAGDAAGIDGVGDAGAPDDDAAGGDGATDACNRIVDDTPAVRETLIGGASPVLNGGAIPDGTYVLVERYHYVSSCDCLVHGKLVIGGGATTIQTLLRTEPAAAERQSGT